MHTSNLEKVYEQATSSGILTFEFPVTNIVVATHAGMYRYLPITNDTAIDTAMLSAAVIFIRRSKEVKNMLLFL